MSKVKSGDVLALLGQEVKVIKCEDCKHLMVNIDVNDVQPGDLLTLKKAGVRLSNPETTNPLCLNCEYDKPTFGQRLRDWFDTDDDDDDSPFFVTPQISRTVSTPTFGGSSSFGGFGGFGGGSFSGGGASRSF